MAQDEWKPTRTSNPDTEQQQDLQATYRDCPVRRGGFGGTDSLGPHDPPTAIYLCSQPGTLQ